jgi:hypothetical protein
MAYEKKPSSYNISDKRDNYYLKEIRKNPNRLVDIRNGMAPVGSFGLNWNDATSESGIEQKRA